MIRYDMKSSSIPLNACAPTTCAIPTGANKSLFASLKSGSGGGEGTSVSGAAVVIFLGWWIQRWFLQKHRAVWKSLFSTWWQLNYFLFSPRIPGEDIPIWRAYFSDGLFQHQLVFFLFFFWGFWKTSSSFCCLKFLKQVYTWGEALPLSDTFHVTCVFGAGCCAAIEDGAAWAALNPFCSAVFTKLSVSREGCLRFSKAVATPWYLQEAQQGGSRLRIVGDALEDRIKKRQPERRC